MLSTNWNPIISFKNIDFGHFILLDKYKKIIFQFLAARPYMENFVTVWLRRCITTNTCLPGSYTDAKWSPALGSSLTHYGAVYVTEACDWQHTASTGLLLR